MECSHCSADIPEGGRFCIECGRPATQAAIGPTVQLADQADGPRCPSCSTLNPAAAHFCVRCGTSLLTPPIAPPVHQPSAPAAIPAAPLPPATPSQANPVWNGLAVGIFLIGLAVIARFNLWWPGILVVIGIFTLIGSVANRKPWAGFHAALWMFGIAVIARFNWWWPGMLVLAGLSTLLASIWRPRSGW